MLWLDYDVVQDIIREIEQLVDNFKDYTRILNYNNYNNYYYIYDQMKKKHFAFLFFFF